eukprot:180961-Amorphochlora_amoeboformis.AAC.2
MERICPHRYSDQLQYFRKSGSSDPVGTLKLRDVSDVNHYEAKRGGRRFDITLSELDIVRYEEKILPSGYRQVGSRKVGESLAGCGTKPEVALDLKDSEPIEQSLMDTNAAYQGLALNAVENSGRAKQRRGSLPGKFWKSKVIKRKYTHTPHTHIHI